MLALDLMSQDMKKLDDLIRARLSSEVDLVNQVAEHIIQAGGKRLRPLLVLLSARAIENQTPFSTTQALNPVIYTLAAVVEFIHNATLLHDDVVDESPLRRGKKTAHTVFGNAASVLVGDFLYSRAFELMVEANQMSIMSLLAKTTNQIAEGEVWQLMNIADTSLTEERYLEVLQFKTATLFSAACQLPALLMNQVDQQAALANYGLYLGLSFQIMDDYLDYAGDASETGKVIGQDLSEGKLTLPLIWLLAHGHKTTQEIIQALITQALSNTTPNQQEQQHHLKEVFLAVQQSDALRYTKQRAQDFAKQAQAALSVLPNSPAKEALNDLCLYNLSRTQ